MCELEDTRAQFPFRATKRALRKESTRSYLSNVAVIADSVYVSKYVTDFRKLKVDLKHNPPEHLNS